MFVWKTICVHFITALITSCEKSILFESCETKMSIYRIYSIKRPGRLLNFWTLRVGVYSRWTLIRGWALIKCLPFLASSMFILQENNV